MGNNPKQNNACKTTESATETAALPPKFAGIARYIGLPCKWAALRVPPSLFAKAHGINPMVAKGYLWAKSQEGAPITISANALFKALVAAEMHDNMTVPDWGGKFGEGAMTFFLRGEGVIDTVKGDKIKIALKGTLYDDALRPELAVEGDIARVRDIVIAVIRGHTKAPPPRDTEQQQQQEILDRERGWRGAPDQLRYLEADGAHGGH